MTGRNVSRHCRQRARDSRQARQVWACPGQPPGTSHFCLDATSEATHLPLDATYQASADNAHETAASQDSYGHAQVNHLGLRTCDWTQRLKPLPTTRTRQSPGKTGMGMSRSTAWDFALLSGRDVRSYAPATGRNVSSQCRQRARDSRLTRQLWACPGESPGTSHL